MTAITNMTSGKPGRLIFTFAVPLMVGSLFQQLYTVFDAMIVGQVLGVNAIAAVGATDWQVWMMLGMAQGFTQGFSIWMAQEFGADRPKQLRSVVFNSVFLSALIAVVMLTFGQLFAALLLQMLHTPSDVFSDAEKYMRTIFWGLPVTIAYNLLAAILRSLGDGKTPLRAMAFASVVNIGLDLLFVAVLNMGIASAAAATVIAQVFAGIFCLVKILHIDILRMTKDDMVIYRSSCMHLMGLGFPLAFQNIVIAVGGMILQFVINGFGVIVLAAFTASNKLYGMLEMAATNYGFAMITYSGQNLGAGKVDRIQQGYRETMVIAMVTSLAISAVMVTCGRIILSWFISGDARTVADTLDIAYHYLFIMSVSLPILYYLHVTRACIQGIGNTVLPMVSGISEFIMRTGAALILPLIIGQEGIFYAETLAWLGADVVLFFSYIYCRKKIQQIYQKPIAIEAES